MNSEPNSKQVIEICVNINKPVTSLNDSLPLDI